MCLIIDPQYRRQYIAGYDILVWKELEPHFHRPLQLVSPFRRTPYKLGQLYTVPRFGVRKGFVHEGLHAHIKKPVYHGDFYPAIIPKGTPFYRGELGDIVSLALVVHPHGWDKRVKAHERGNWARHQPRFKRTPR